MITIVGSSNVDLVIKVPKIPAIGETVLGGKFIQIFGGKGANQAIAAKRAGGEIHFITKVGGDIHGEQLRNHFQNEKIDLSGILIDNNAETGIAQIWVSDKGENSIVVAPGANLNLLKNDIHEFDQILVDSNYVLMQMEIPISTIEYISDQVFANKGKVILNPAPAHLLPEDLWKKIWMITPNEAEVSLLTGMDVKSSSDIINAAKIILAKGVKEIIITMGERGCFWSNGKNHEFFPAFSVDVIDSTAAGDVFNGTLVTALDESKNMHDAIMFATAAAAISVSRLGAQTSIPGRIEIENFINENNKQTTSIN